MTDAVGGAGVRGGDVLHLIFTWCLRPLLSFSLNPPYSSFPTPFLSLYKGLKGAFNTVQILGLRFASSTRRSFLRLGLETSSQEL